MEKHLAGGVKKVLSRNKQQSFFLGKSLKPFFYFLFSRPMRLVPDLSAGKKGRNVSRQETTINAVFFKLYN